MSKTSVAHDLEGLRERLDQLDALHGRKVKGGNGATAGGMEIVLPLARDAIALASRLSQQGWRPIESAPKEMSVLVAYESAGGPRATTAWFNDNRIPAEWTCDVGVIEPYLWRHIPAAPEPPK